MPLIENAVSALKRAELIRVVGITAGRVRLDGICRVRPGVTGEHRKVVTEPLGQVQLHSLVEAFAVVDYSQDALVASGDGNDWTSCIGGGH